MYRQQPREPAPLYGNRKLTQEEQEAEDLRLAMALQAEEDAQLAAERSRVRRDPPPVATRDVGSRSTVSQSTTTRSFGPNPSAPKRAPQPSSAEEDEDYKLALALAGDTPQDYDAAIAADNRSATFVPPPSRAAASVNRSVPAVATAPASVPRTTPSPSSTSPAARPQVAAAPFVVIDSEERKLTKEEQEAEDLRLATEIQALEEAAAMREGRPIPQLRPAATSIPASSNTNSAPPASRATDLFASISLPATAPGIVGKAPVAPPPQTATRSIMDDLFAAPAPAPAPVAVAPPPTAAAPEFDFFAAVPAAPVASPPMAWGAPAPATATYARPPQPNSAASPASAPPNVIDDLFAPVPSTSSFQGAPQQPRPQQPVQAYTASDMNSNLDFFAATAKPQTRSW